MNIKQIIDYFIHDLKAETLVENLPRVRYRYQSILNGLKVEHPHEILDLSPAEFKYRKEVFIENTEIDMNLMNDLFIIINS